MPLVHTLSAREPPVDPMSSEDFVGTIRSEDEADDKDEDSEEEELQVGAGGFGWDDLGADDSDEDGPADMWSTAQARTTTLEQTGKDPATKAVGRSTDEHIRAHLKKQGRSKPQDPAEGQAEERAKPRKLEEEQDLADQRLQAARSGRPAD